MKILVPILILIVACGCQNKGAPDRPALDANYGTSYALSSTSANLSALGKTLTGMGAYVVERGRPYYEAALGFTADAVSANAKADEQNNVQRTEIVGMGNVIRQQDADLKKIEAKWYVRWGKFVERVLWIIAITWLVCGVGGMLLTSFFPAASVLFLIGKFLLNALPFANVFSFGSHVIENSRA